MRKFLERKAKFLRKFVVDGCLKISSRNILIAKRWRDIAFYSVLAAAIVKILLMPLAAKALGLIPINSLVEIASLLLIAGASVVGIFWSLGLWRWSHPWPWNRAFRAHPPLWLAMALGFVWVTLPYPDCVYAFLITTFFIIVLLALGKGELLTPAETHEFEGADVSQWEPKKLLQWANEELPVQAGTPLLFGRKQYAQRIFKRLCPSTGDLTREPKSFALLGELGSGKSSVINALVKAFQKNDWLVVEVDAWGREASNLDEQILELVIDGLAKVVDVTGYKTIPSAYHDALKSHGGWWSVVSHLANGQAEAKDKLKRINNLLLLIEKQLLLVIEDPDRGVAADKEKRCQRIFSLLDRLQQLEGNRIKVVVTGGVDLLSGDLRVIEFKEELDDPAKAYADILNAFVNSEWDLEPMGKIWANGKPVFESLNFPFGTPRDFKHVIRDVDALWKKDGELCGEIDLKQLVLLSFLKEVSFRKPESQMFEYLKTWLNEELSTARCYYRWGNDTAIFQSPRKSISQKEESEEKDTKSDASKDIWQRLSLDDQRVVTTLCYEVLGERNDRTLQSVRCGGRVDYLKRFLRRSVQDIDSVDVDVNNLLPEEKLSDQTYLRAMANIYKALTSGNPLKYKDVKRLIYAGHLSPYLYSRMNGVAFAEFRDDKIPLSPKCWSELAHKIIELMPALPYSPNDEGHPAGMHLNEIVSFLLQSKEGVLDKDSELAGIEIALKALKAGSEAGGDLLYKTSLLSGYCLKFESNLETVWSFYREALNNSAINPPTLDNPEKINWKFIWGLQKSALNNKAGWLNKLEELVMDHGYNLDANDHAAIDKAIALFELLQHREVSESIWGKRRNVQYEVTFNPVFSNNDCRPSWIERLKNIKNFRQV